MKRSHQVETVLVLSILPMVGQYLISPTSSPVHDLYQRLCYLPIILSGLWFGARGGILTALLIAVLYFPNIQQRPYGPPSPFHRLMESAIYVMVGWLTGWLADRLRRSHQAERLSRAEVDVAYEKLKSKTEELLAMGDQLRRSDRLAALGQLAAGLAHEIRNPLASIKVSVEVLRGREAPHVCSDSEDDIDFSAIILEETARLDQTLTKFLQFARDESLSSPDEPHIASVLEVFQEVLELTASNRGNGALRVHVDEKSLDVPVAICPSLLHQVLLNLLINSMDAMPGGGEFRLHRLADEGNLVVLLAEDTGPGVPHSVASRVFDPFFSTKEQGTGLGLSIVERILTSNGGSIALAMTSSNPSSRFLIKLPRST